MTVISGFFNGVEASKKMTEFAQQDPDVVREYHRILGMQNEKGDQLARLYLADEIVKLRRALATKSLVGSSGE